MPYLPLPNGDEIHYQTIGTGPPLALVPGLNGVTSFYDPFIPTLQERFTLILHDHRGAGRSSAPEIAYSIDQMRDDLLAVLDGLGIERCHVVGHSAGGAIAQALAIDHPERVDRLVLGGTWGGSDFYVRRVCEVRARALRESGPQAAAELTTLFMKPAAWLVAHAAELEKTEAAAAVLDAKAIRIALSRITAVATYDRLGDLHRIMAPALVLGARDDFAMPAYLSEDLARRISGAELVIVPEGGHFFPQVVPDLYLRLVVDFLTRPTR